MTRPKTKPRAKPRSITLKINVERERPDAYWELSDGDHAGRDVLCDRATSQHFPSTVGSLKGAFTLTTKARPGAVRVKWNDSTARSGSPGWEVNGQTHDHADPFVVGSALDGLKNRLFYATFEPVKVKARKTVTVTARFTSVPGALNFHQPAGAINVGGYDLRDLLGMNQVPPGASDGAYMALVEVVK